MDTFLALGTLTRFFIPSLKKDQWSQLDEELRGLLQPFHHHLGLLTNPEDVAHVGDQIINVIHTFLSGRDIFYEKPSSPHSDNYISHESRSLTEVKKVKNHLRRKAFRKTATEEDRQEWRAAVKAVSHLKRRERQTSEAKTVKHQEDLYRKDFYAFSKQAVQGQLQGHQQGQVGFSKQEADIFYPSTYSVPGELSLSSLAWFPPIKADPTSDSFVNYDQSPVTPTLVKKVLHGTNQKSSPGPDGIRYGILAKLPTCHHILATLYTLVMKFGIPPPSWSESTITIIHKKGNTGDPTNFRMIALSSTIGKLYHLILAKRLTGYLLSNKIIDPSIQKAFLPGISGCFEHNQVKVGRLSGRRPGTLSHSVFNVESSKEIQCPQSFSSGCLMPS